MPSRVITINPASSSPAVPAAGKAAGAEDLKVRRLARLILLLYFAIYYLGPAILTFIFGAPLDQILIASPNYLLGLIFAAVVTGLVYWVIGFIAIPRLTSISSLARVMFDDRVLLGVSVVFLYISYQFWQEFGLSYRQTGERIGESGFLVIILYILQNYLIVALLLLVGRSVEELRQSGPVLGAAIFCTVIGFFLSLQASSNIIVMAIAMLVGARLATRRELLRPVAGRSSIPTYVLLGLVVAGALFVGIANKRGVDETTYLLFNNIGEVIRIFQTRLSYHYYSASFHTTYHFTNVELGWRAVEEVWGSIGHRLDVLLGNPTTFNETTSVKRLNYELTAYYFNDRTGTAPGMIGAVYFFPLGVFALPLIVLLYSGVLCMIAAAGSGRSLTFFEIAFLVMIFGGIVDASIDLVNVFDTTFTKMFFVLFACALVRNRKPAEAPRASPNAAAPMAI